MLRANDSVLFQVVEINQTAPRIDCRARDSYLEPLAADRPPAEVCRKAAQRSSGSRAHTRDFDPRRPDELVAIVSRLLEDPTHHDERRAAASGFTPRRWDDVVAEVGGVLASAVGRSAP